MLQRRRQYRHHQVYQHRRQYRHHQVLQHHRRHQLHLALQHHHQCRHHLLSRHQLQRGMRFIDSPQSRMGLKSNIVVFVGCSNTIETLTGMLLFLSYLVDTIPPLNQDASVSKCNQKNIMSYHNC